MEIIELTKEEYKGKEILFEYTTKSYYDVTFIKNSNGYEIKFEEKELDEEIKKSFTDKLFEDYLENPSCFGILTNEKIIGLVETNFESWNQRLRISNIYVDNDFRHQGIGTKLMDKAKEIAEYKQARMIILETQSCNTKAINFYHKCGFTLIGFDSCCYSNNDLDKKEVRMEFGYLIK